ncbi:hypothetical protein GOV07_03820 [Candidatus Woesearchaeota archaeon]|nr:hypothetical protein [Candidatus Woesearchaeota archaeon]
MKRILALVVLLTFIVACADAQPQQQPLGIPFIGGTDGLEMGLVEGMPPAAVYDGDRMAFGIGVAIENVGESDVGLDTENPYLGVSLEGFVPSVFGIDAVDDLNIMYDGVLLGARKNFDGTILPGQLTRVVFDGLSYQGLAQGNYIQNFLVNLCYDYQGRATVPICFKDDIIENVIDTQICTLTGEKGPQNSGAPIAITSLVQNPMNPHQVMVNFIIEHVGTGDFYGRDPDGDTWTGLYTDETCDSSITNINKYRVEVQLLPPPGSNMLIECSSFDDTNTGVVILYQGAPMTVTCTLTGDGVETGARIYTDMLTIMTRYRYGESIIQPVVVQAVGHQ